MDNEAHPIVTGDTSCYDTDTNVSCDLSWESYFTTNSLFGNPVGLHSIAATAKNVNGIPIGTYNYDLTVPSFGLPILAIDVPCDAETHDAIYVIDPGTAPDYFPIPAYLQQPAGTYLDLPVTGFTLRNPFTLAATFDSPIIQVSNGKVYVLNNYVTSGGSPISDIEICYRTIGDHTSAWTHLVFGTELTTFFGGVDGLAQNGCGPTTVDTFKVDADGGVWVSVGGNLIGDTYLLNHVVYLPPGSSTWQVVYSDHSRNAGIFFAGPKKTIPSIFSEAYPSFGLPGVLGMWNGTSYTYMADTVGLSTNNDTGVGWTQFTASPAVAYSSTAMFGYKTDLVNNGVVDVYYMTDTETLGPYYLMVSGGNPVYGDYNLWPTSLGVSILWNIGMLVEFMGTAWIGASFDFSGYATSEPVYSSPMGVGGGFATSITLTASILTPPTGSQFGAFPVVLLNSSTSFGTAYGTGTMTELSDNYILCYLTV
jgi:hypothetical protein